MKTIKSILAPMLMAIAFLCSPTAHATIVNWTLEDVVFSDGGVATGSFTTDSITGELLSYAITTSAGSAMAGYVYDGIDDAFYCNNCFAANSFIVVNTLGGFGDPFLQLAFTDPLTSSGNNSLVLGGWSSGSAEVTNNGFDPHRDVVSGFATTNAVPEPESLALFGLALAGMALTRRKAKQA